MAGVFARGFEFHTDEAIVREHFCTCGDIIGVYFQSRNAAVITYASSSAASRAVSELHGSTIKGQSRWVAVKLDNLDVLSKGESRKGKDGKGGKGQKGNKFRKGKGSNSKGGGVLMFETAATEVSINIVSALTGEHLVSLSVLPTATVEHVKRRVQETVGVIISCQKLFAAPDDTELSDEATLGNYTSPLTLKLVKLSQAGDLEMNEGLLSAARDGDVAQASSMLKQRAWPDFADDDSCTPLMLASENGHVQVVQLLCNAGVDKDREDDGGRSPIYVASQMGHAAVVQLLCDIGADVHSGPQGWSPICIAHRAGHPEVAQLLLEHGADIDDLDASTAFGM